MMFRWLSSLFSPQHPERRADRHESEAPPPLQFLLRQATPPPLLVEPTPAPRQRISSNWPHQAPLFLDVETTGLHSNDRIVSLAMVLITEGDSGQFQTKRQHLLFDPCKKSHPDAEKIHGYDDWTLRHQPMFFEHAKEVWALLAEADVLVAHNSEFDMRFIRAELEACGYDLGDKPTHCTMQMARSMGLPASLSACVSRLGPSRASGIHDAAEDAWLCAMVYMHHFCGPGLKVRALLSLPVQNRLPVPPRPDELPRRNNKRRIVERQSVMSQSMESEALKCP